MNIAIPIERIDLSNMEVGIDFPSIEKEIRKIATEFIKGVLENNLRIEVQQVDESEEMYVVVWSSLQADWETPIAEVKVTDLFLEYQAQLKEKNT
jgi:hypothetical protein